MMSCPTSLTKVNPHITVLSQNALAYSPMSDPQPVFDLFVGAVMIKMMIISVRSDALLTC